MFAAVAAVAAVAVVMLVSSLVLPAVPATAAGAEAGDAVVAAAGGDAVVAAAGGDAVPERLLVRWRDNADALARQRTLDAVLSDLGGEVTSRRVSEHVDALEAEPVDAFGAGTASTGASDLPAAPTGASYLDALATALRARPEVVLVERDRLLPIASVGAVTPAPNDPLFVQQWGLRNLGAATGPAGSVQGTAGIDIRLLEAWAITRGEPRVTVAVIDTVVDVAHRDLVGAVTQQVSTREGATVPGAAGIHGTAVAGIIGARAQDAFGMAGVAPNVAIVSAAAFADGTGGDPGQATLGSVLAAFDVAVATGADVINASWVTTDPSPLLRDAVASSGVPVVAATGNDGRLLTPASRVYPVGFDLPNVVAVTAHDRNGAVASFANVGPTVVDVAAPGVEVRATGTADQHVWADGTSFAAPHVSGALALAVTVAPYATTAELVDAVSWTSRVVPGLSASTRTGGMLDAGALVRGVQRPVCRPDRLTSAGFPDVDPGNVHASGIDCIAANQVTTGRLDGTFGPGAPVTREQLASFLFRILVAQGADPQAPPSGLVDVDPGSVHAPAIDLLYELGIVFGDEQGRFRPHDTVTRGQMASLLVRTHEQATGGSVSASRTWFADSTSSVHAAGIFRARDLGIVRGVTRTAFEPGAPTRRGQMASFLARTLDALERVDPAPEAVPAGG